MWKFWEIELPHFQTLLRSGKLDDKMDELYNQFWGLPHSHQYELIAYSKEKSVFPSVETFREVFKVSKESVKEFFRAEYRTFRFPVVSSEGKGELVNALVIKNLKEVITNLKEIKRHLNPIREFLKGGFAVFFDREFAGASFQLATVLNLYVENLPEDALFTGAIDKKGNIKSVNGIEEKKRLTKELGLRLVEPYHFNTVDEIKQLLDAESYQIPIYITKTQDRWEGEFKSFLKATGISEDYLKKLEVLIGLETKPIITGQLNQEAWEHVLREFWKKFKETERKLHSKERWHIAINGPSVLAFALGVLFGSQKPFVFYHYQNNAYHPIFVDNVRELKERKENLEKIEYRFEKGGENLVVMLSFAHHEMEGDVKNYISKELENPSYLILRAKGGGNIQVEDMKEVAKESASVIQNLRKENTFENFHFFISTPVPIAFMVGLSFGHYGEGYLYNYSGGTYEPVVSFSFLKALREGKYEKAYL
ncbi:SAVED domain-containing protein [Thermocrinis sp.]|uniref:SAVED domain-containing protein n=1 Tax=Thermocrinis sp. TaxID=2024383 RepID=UPI002FDE122F